jgi:hypothetical protein
MTLERGDDGRIAWLSGWALAAVILIAGAGMAAIAQDFSEPDNAMRLVRVRDMLAGQGWFDNVQHRLNPPEGTPMHWAQWIDALLAAPIALLAVVVGQTNAEIAIAFIWPLGLLGAFMFFAVRISGELGAADGLKREAQWTAAIVAALAFPATEKFAPGSFDHHNVELVLALASVWCLMRMREHPMAGLWAGAALGLAMATAAEGVPVVMAGLLIAGLLWLVRPSEYRAGFARLGIGLAASSAIALIALVPPTEWSAPVCDAMGAPFLGLGLIGGGIAFALSAAPQIATSTIWRRAASAAVLGAIGAFALAKLFPQCLGGGYSALGEDMNALWMTQISETRSLGALLGDDPAMILSVAGAAFAGLVAAAFYLRSHWREPTGWIVLGFLAVSWLILAWQIRGTAFATTFAIPFGAWAVAFARREYRVKTSAIRALAFAGVAAGSAAAAWASAGEALQSRFTDQRVLQGYETRVADAKACATPAAFRSLAAAPKGVMLNQFALGAGVLVWTEHSVLSGPYHRNVTGTMTTIEALRSAPARAHAIVKASAADYVLVCQAGPETAFYARNAAEGVSADDTLSAMLGRGEHPDWLAPVDIGASPLSLYRVIPP